MISLKQDGLFLLLLFAIPWACTGCGVSESSPGNTKALPPAVKVTVAKIEPETVKDILVLPGETEARHDVLLAAERDGRVEAIGPQEGDLVEKGQLLMEIDPAVLKAGLDRCQAALNMAEQVGERRKNLHKRGMISQEALDTALTDLERARCDHREAKEHFEQGFIRSPITGRLNRLHVDPGEFVQRGTSVAELVNVRTIRININVPEMDVRYLKVGQDADVKIDAYPEKRWDGKVDFVAFKADPETKTFKVRVVVDNADGKIRPGMLAHVAFLRRLIRDAVTVPLFSIVDKGGERIVFVERDGKAGARTVTVGVVDGNKAQIIDGLKAGENVIVTGQKNVEEGTRVTVQ